MSFKDIADALLGRKSVIPEMNELAYRPSVLPVARTKGGELTAAWPQIVTEPLQNIRAFMDDPSAATAAPVALDMAGGGMMVGSAPAGALAANAGRRGLTGRPEAWWKYIRGRKWDSADEARDGLKYYIDKWNRPDEFGKLPDPLPYGLIDDIGIVKKRGGYGLSEAGGTTWQALELLDEPRGESWGALWDGPDLQDYRKTAKPGEAVLNAYVPLDQLPKEKLAGGRTGYDWEELDAAREIPPVTVRRNPNGTVSIIDGNHRIYRARELGHESIPAYVIGGDASGLDPRAQAAKQGAADALNAERRGITAYHGSPHDFDRFDLSKIGTGEGAQAYGHGLYFAENEGVAKAYRDAYSTGNSAGYNPEHLPDVPRFRTLGGEPEWIDPDVAREIALEATYSPKAARDVASRRLAAVENEIAGLEKMPRSAAPDEIIEPWRREADEIKRLIDGGEFVAGRMYKVRINADPEDFLDWDAPLSEQPGILRRFGYDEAKYPEDWIPDISMKGSELYRHLGGQSEIGQTQSAGELASNAPRPIRAKDGSIIDRPLGIPGIKYYDQGSRGAGEGTRNYVVFDDSLIDILEKYGIANPFGPRMDDPDRNTKEWLARFDPRRVN